MRGGWKGLMIKSRAPAWMASMTIPCWPMAETMMILASGSSARISFTASMPFISGITISIVTRSGLVFRYISTASLPVEASPARTKLSFRTMFFRRVRMKVESSTNKTLVATGFFLPFQGFHLGQGFDLLQVENPLQVQEDDQPVLNLHHAHQVLPRDGRNHLRRVGNGGPGNF